MNPAVIQIILSAAAVILGGAFLEFLRRVLPKNRRAELRTLDTKSDATTMDSQNAYILTLQAGDKASREEVQALKAELLSREQKWDSELAASAESIGVTQRELTRCTAKVGRLEAELAVAQHQIRELSALLPSRHAQPDTTQMATADQVLLTREQREDIAALTNTAPDPSYRAGRDLPLTRD